MTDSKANAQTASESRPAVTVVGLGEMGAALAGAFLDAGHPTTIWNRSPRRADSLVARGAVQAATVTDAVAASRLLVVNVASNAAARQVLDEASDVLSGRVLVNLTDGTSEEARRMAAWAIERGADYLHGQIMTIAPGIGQPESTVFYGGPQVVFATHEPTLKVLAGGTTYLSDDAGIPSLYGMAVHGVMWATLNGFLHALALLATEGIEGATFLHHAAPSLTGVASVLPGIAQEVDRGEHGTDYGSLRLHLSSISHLVEESAARGIDVALPERTKALVEEAIARGHAGDSYSRVVDLLSKPAA
jgi:3-hydroxyisobutyrate dehydrogenase-like beta-hydroxyacid dehydrogenase